MRVELREEARDDLVVGAMFYRRQVATLEDHFISCLRDDLRNLETTFGVHERYRGFYRKLSRRFPFAIYYLVTDEVVDVVAILDCRMDSDAIDHRISRSNP